jgi:hypothetical protein
VSIPFLLVCVGIAAAAALVAYGLIALTIGWLDRVAQAKVTERSSHAVPTP